MKTMTIREAKVRLDEILHEPGSEPVLILQDGEPVGLLSPLTDPDEVERFKMAYSTQLQTILARGRQEIVEGKGMNHEEFWANLEDEEGS
jgi:antitoxin (DNA-binding transcriptional repressor) of toxin-antitoxin stability system